MSQEPASTPLGAPERDVLDRLLVRVPALAGLMVRCVRRIQPGSSLRRRLTKLLAKRAFAAMARSDVDVVLLSYEPDALMSSKWCLGLVSSQPLRGFNAVLSPDQLPRRMIWSGRWEIEPIVCALAPRCSAIELRPQLVGNPRIELGMRIGAGFTDPLSHQTWRYPKVVAGVGIEPTVPFGVSL